jgi:hypothetical protein
MARLKFIFLLVCACLLTLGVQELDAATVTYIVGTCKAGTRFTTIQSALNAKPAPNMVQVCPGTYAEQITITEPVTIQGLSIDNTSVVRITPPAAGLATNATINAGDPAAAQIFVKNATGAVNLTNILVDGSNNQVMQGTFLLGVFYQHSPGTLNHVVTFAQQGGSGGWGIYVEGGTSNPIVVVENCNVTFFDFGGIYVVGPNGPTANAGQEHPTSDVTASQVTATVENNYLFAGGSAEHDIYLGSSTTPTALGNIVIGGGFGIQVDSAAGMIATNTIEGTDVGIEVQGDGASVKNNKIFAAATFGILVDVNLKTSQITDNTIVSSSNFGIDLNCVTTGSPSVVHANTFINVSIGYIDAPTGFNSTNTYESVGNQINSPGCGATVSPNSKPAILRQSAAGSLMPHEQ